MRLQTLCVLTIAVVCVAAAATAQATYLPANVVNIDFNGLRSGDSVGPTYSDAIVPGSGTTWNGITVDSVTYGDDQTVGGTNLLNSAGGATSISISLTHVGGDNDGAGTNAALVDALGYDYAFAFGTSTLRPTITISGLGSVTVADIALISRWGDGALVGASFVGASTHGEVITIGGTTSNGISLVPFYNVPVNNGVITGYLTDGVTASQLAVLSGMSIATVPEPGTLVLACTGLLGLLCYAWRKRR